jgi:hypothetical protein
VVSAEISDDPQDAALVRKFMMHNHPPAHLPAVKYCQRESTNGIRTCRFKYPHKLQISTTVDVEGRVQYRSITFKQDGPPLRSSNRKAGPKFRCSRMLYRILSETPYLATPPSWPLGV